MENHEQTHEHDNPQNDGTNTTRPIGYWLRAADRLISREFGAALGSEDLTRREWMLLNVLDGSVAAPHLAERVQRGGKKLRALAERGWVAESDGVWTLTDDGRAAKARLSEVVDGIRLKVAAAVSDEDYATTIASLEAISRALGWDEKERLPRADRPGFGRRGFGPGFGRRGFGPRPGFGPFRPGFGPGSGPDVAGGPDHASDRHRFGHPGHPGHPGHRGGHRCADIDERAYERGFDAGFSRGRADRSV